MENLESYLIKNICCIGAGYVGGPTMAVIADKCPTIEVNVVDIDHKRIKSWNEEDLSRLPVFEPGLDNLIKKNRNKNLFFTTKIEDSIKKADMVFISVNTPTKKNGVGAGLASDLCWVESCARQVAEFAQSHTIVVEKSTLPVRTAEAIESILNANLNADKEQDKSFSVLSNPEFLAEGSAINDLINPDRVLIGGRDIKAMNALKSIYLSWVDQNKILYSSLWSSELSKLVSNAFLAQRISSINSISALCEKTDADIREVSMAIGRDKRIGANFLNVSPGFGGSCFKKDILNLVYLANYYGLPEVSQYWEQVVKINDWQKKRISNLIIKKLFGTISGKKIAVLGFAFKANTNDTRESAAISICQDFLIEGAKVAIHDPKVDPKQISLHLNQSQKDLEELNSMQGGWQFFENIYESISDSDAILILTEWDQYKDIDWFKVSNIMRSPSWVFDTRSIVNETSIKKTNLNYWNIGSIQ